MLAADGRLGSSLRSRLFDRPQQKPGDRELRHARPRARLHRTPRARPAGGRVASSHAQACGSGPDPRRHACVVQRGEAVVGGADGGEVEGEKPGITMALSDVRVFDKCSRRSTLDEVPSRSPARSGCDAQCASVSEKTL